MELFNNGNIVYVTGGVKMIQTEKELLSISTEFYVVMGYDEQSRTSLLGLFSSEEAATQCGQEHLDCENIIRFEVENLTLDEFGFK